MCLSRVRRAQNDASISYIQFGITEADMTLLVIAENELDVQLHVYASIKARLKGLTEDERGSPYGTCLAKRVLEENMEMDAKTERFVELYQEEHGVEFIDARFIATQMKRNIFVDYGLNDTD